jgi:hypothetical protein
MLLRPNQLLALVLVLSSPGLGAAAKIGVIEQEGMARVTVEGRLIAEDAANMKMKIGPYSQAIVEFKSEGGSLTAGIQIGEMIRLKNFTTLVPDNSRCSSACALAWLGGTQRFLGDNAEIGFHAAYDETTGQETGVGNALVGAYLARIGLPYSAVVYITQAAPSSMTWLNLKDAEQQGIDVKPLHAESRHAKTASLMPTQGGAGGDDLEQRATNFILGLMEQLSGDPTSALRFLSSVYAPQVDYYGVVKDRDIVLKSKRQLFKQWPVRKYVIKPDSLHLKCDPDAAMCSVTGAMEWSRASERRNAYASGSSDFAYDVRLGDRGFGIVAENSSVISQHTMGAAPSDRPHRTPARKWPPFDWPFKWD